MKALLCLFGALACAFAHAAPETVAFQAARPVWPAGRDTEMNLFVEFRASFQKPARGPALLRLTGASVYRIWLNGEFAGYGPARAGGGVYRVDEWDLGPKLARGRNEVRIEVAGYNVNSFYLMDEPSFLQAEVVGDGKVLAATGGAGFTAAIRRDRVQKVQRYSFQRTFSEIWQLPAPAEPVTCAEVAAKSLAPRRVPYPKFALRRPVAHLAAGTLREGPLPEKPWVDRSLAAISPQLKGFARQDIPAIPSLELQRWGTSSWGPATDAMQLRAGGFHVVDLGVNATGFIGATVTVRAPTQLCLLFDEILTDGDVDWKRLNCVNIVRYDLAPGTYHLESFEPYTLRYLKAVALTGDCTVTGVYLREYANPEAERARFVASDARLNRIFEAARRTLADNAVDLFTDCPSRERAGWLCDSFFTARAALDLCGNTNVERSFLENFAQPRAFAFLPAGMLPMCYPADQYNGQYIPNWAMWFVLQLQEYLDRSGDRALVDELRPRVFALIDFLKRYENTDGLLEKLPGWVFVEWSDANKYVQDVNYPTNMLYAAMLETAGRLYDRPDLVANAAQRRETIRRQSFDGRFFVDNAVRTNGELQVTHNRTEVCQYFAFFFGLATPETQPALWKTLVENFGPHHKGENPFGVSPANAFIGDQLRFELLSRAGLTGRILTDAIGQWFYMAERTGTLWEHDAPQASCNHGFASHAAHILLRDVLGLYRIDTRQRVLTLRLVDVPLEQCEGSVPTVAGPITLQWQRTSDRLRYHVVTPPGYRIETENLTGLRLEAY